MCAHTSFLSLRTFPALFACSSSVPVNPSASHCTASLPPDLLELREKFEADKRRLAELKAARKFKPY